MTPEQLEEFRAKNVRDTMRTRAKQTELDREIRN